MKYDKVKYQLDRLSDLVDNKIQIASQLFLVLFFGLKIYGVINWPWLWLISPLWIPPVLTIIMVLVIMVFVEVCDFIKKKRV